MVAGTINKYSLKRKYIYLDICLFFFFSYLIAFLLNLSLTSFSYLRVICGFLSRLKINNTDLNLDAKNLETERNLSFLSFFKDGNKNKEFFYIYVQL